MSSVFFQTFVYILFCCTYLTTFLAVITHDVKFNFYKNFCVTGILWSVYLFFLTEFLSAFNNLTAYNLALGWAFLSAIEIIYCLIKRNATQNKIKILSKNFCIYIQEADSKIKAMLIFIAFFMAIRFVLALVTIPHNYDSMTYHLPRIMYWIQHKSVDYYETCVTRQLFSPVFAEYINLHVMSLTHGDIFVNMLQYFASCGCLILIYGLVKKFTCNKKFALFACILAMCMNIFAAESLSTQVDMIGAFYFCVITYMITEIFLCGKIKICADVIFHFILMGLCAGLIYITKTNACIPAAVIIIFVTVARLFKKDSVLSIIALCVVSLTFIFAVTFPTFYRNYKFFDGDFLARLNVDNISIGSFAPKYIFMNILKNLGSCGVERNSEMIEYGMLTFSNIMGVNINDPVIAFSKHPYHISYALNMDVAGAHIVTPLFLIAAVICIIYLIKRHNSTDFLMFAFILQMFSLLIAVKWQPTGSRLLLPSLIIAVIPVAYYLHEIFNKFAVNKSSWKYKACYFIVLELIFQCGICSCESLLFHTYVTAKSAFSHQARYALYANFGGDSKDLINKIFKIIDSGSYGNIGLYTGQSSMQYPILAKYVFEGKRVENVIMSDNGSINKNFQPDIILVIDIKMNPENLYTCNNSIYKCVYNFSGEGNYSVWVKN